MSNCCCFHPRSRLEGGLRKPFLARYQSPKPQIRLEPDFRNIGNNHVIIPIYDRV